jgi:hypothetical protein
MDHVHIVSVFLTILNGSVRNGWASSQELVLKLSVVINDVFLLVLSDLQKLAFLLWSKSLELLKSLLHLSLNKRKNWIILVSHNSTSDSSECRLKGCSLDFSCMSWILNLSENLVNRSLSNVSHLEFKICVLVELNEVEHGDSSMVEVSLSIELAIGQEVSKSSLLNKLVLFINSIVLELLFSVLQMLGLEHLDGISPLVRELLVLIVRVSVVENGELWTNEEGEVLSLDKTDVETEEHLVMPDHCSKPVIMFPTSHS